MNLIYACVFYQENYVTLLKLLFISLFANSTINKETTEIMIVTHPRFQANIQKQFDGFKFPIKFYLLDLTTFFQAGYARFLIFNYPDIRSYDKILYLDTDILINSDITKLFEFEISSQKIYVLKEGHIGHDYWGGKFFDFTKYDKLQSGFTSGILLFKPSREIEILFEAVRDHIIKYVYIDGNMVPICLDQPFIVYNAIEQNKCDMEILVTLAENNPTEVNANKIIYHFPGDLGIHKSKFAKMLNFGKKMNLFPKSTKPIENQKYSWQNSFITFLENGKMDAFGTGIYEGLDSHTIYAFFGGRLHIMTFNEDHTQFVSMRTDDNEQVVGDVIK